MKRVIFGFLFLQGVLMSSEVFYVDIKKVQVPVIFEQSKNLPIVSLQLVFAGAGSISSEDIGIASFVAKVLNEGTLKMGSSAFAKALDEKAINLSVNADTETISFSLSSLKEEFNFGASLLKQLLKEPNLTEDVFNKVLIQIKGTILNKESDFDYIASTKLNELMFEKTPLGKNSIGTIESINNITLEKIENFIDKQIDISSVIVIIGGDISKNSAKKLISNLLEDLHVGAKKELPFFNVSKSQKSVTEIKKANKLIYILVLPFTSKQLMKMLIRQKLPALS